MTDNRRITPALLAYISEQILPLYANFDAAHQIDHVRKVISDSMEMANRFEVISDMVYTIAAYHDVGLVKGREKHHIFSGQYIRNDAQLRTWFNPEQIETMAQAVEDHRASAKQPPRSIYGCIVAEADRNICLETIICRTVQYGLAHYPELDREGHIQRAISHLEEKYSRRGYLRLWIPGSPNEKPLCRVWDAIDDKEGLRKLISEEFDGKP